MTVTYVFASAGRTETNSRTGNPAAVYYGEFSGGGDTATFTAWLEGSDLYFGVTSRGQLTGPDTLSLWSASVEPFPLTRTAGP